MPKTAVDIYQSYLDTSSSRLMKGQFQKISEMFSYPYRMETLDAMKILNTPEEAMTSAQEFLAYIHRMGGSDFFRICKFADYVGDTEDQIKGQHEGYVLKGGTYMVEPYVNEMTLTRWNGQWLGNVFRSFSTNATVSILSPKQLRERALAKQQEIEGNKSND